SVRAGEKLTAPPRPGESAGGAGGDAEALSGGRKVAVALPARVALHLVMCVEAIGSEQAVGETERHGGVIAPSTAGQRERTAADQRAYRREAAGAAVLRRGRDRIRGREAEQGAEKPLTQSAGCGERGGVQEGVLTGGSRSLHGRGDCAERWRCRWGDERVDLARQPAANVVSLRFGLRDGGPELGALALLP